MSWSKALPGVIFFLVLVVAWLTLGSSGYADAPWYMRGMSSRGSIKKMRDSGTLATVTGSAGALMNTAPVSTLTTPVPSAQIVPAPSMPAQLKARKNKFKKFLTRKKKSPPWTPAPMVPRGVKRVCYDMY